MKVLRIGLLGCGTVGGGFVRLVARERARIQARFGFDLDIRSVLVRDPARARPVPRELLTTIATDAIDSECEVVVEAIGGVHSAGAFVRRAISRGRDVVTANKALLANTGHELFELAERSAVTIGFEASVCGGIPVIGAIRQGLAGDSIVSIEGVLNGTCNFVLSRMERGSSLVEAVACAQELGFAEADPSMDLSGTDAAQKLAILAGIAFDVPVRRTRIIGIDSIGFDDIRAARRKGQVIRQVAEARRVAGGLELSVEARALRRDHPLARLIDEQNGVVIHAEAVGPLVLTGRGAGSMPTAAALLSDVIAVGLAKRAARQWAAA